MNLQKIYAVDTIDLALLKSNPPHLLIEVAGRVSSSGWGVGHLIPYAYITPPADGIQDFDVIAEAPGNGVIVLPKETFIRIEHTLPSVDIQNFWGPGIPLAGIRCHATSNTKEGLFEARKGMPAVLTVEAGDIANYASIGPGGPVFSQDIKPLFRPRDVNAMRNFGGFDLHAYEDVKANAKSILERLSDGSMPCDGRWPDADIALFKSWMDAGAPA